MLEIKKLSAGELKSIPGYDNHELVIRFENKETGLLGFVAIHNTNLGPASGGTRMYPYTSTKDALIDALKLSRAMTYKCAIAGITNGGGKAVIIGDIDHHKNHDLLKAFVEVVNSFNGKFYTGEDVGISENDIQFMLNYSKFFIGRSNFAGDPSPYTALGTFYIMRNAAENVFGSSDLSKRTIGIKGVGKVGIELLKLLTEAGASVMIADIKQDAVNRAVIKYPKAKVVSHLDIHSQPMDIFAPCALSGDINWESVSQIKAKLICGVANNQLESPEINDELIKKGILYVPDYLSNAGGLIDLSDELEKGGYNKERVMSRIKNLPESFKEIFQISKKENISFAGLVDQLAEQRFKNGKTANQK